MLEGGAVPALFAESRTLFIPKSSDVDNNGRIVRSLAPVDAVQLRLQDTHHSDLWRISLVHHEMYTSFSEMYLSQAKDRWYFEIETAALALVACAPRESGIFLTDFAAAFPGVNHVWIFHALEKTELPEFICRFLRRIHYDSTTHVEFAGTTRGQFLMARSVRQGCPASGFLFATAFDPIFRCSRKQSSQGVC